MTRGPGRMLIQRFMSSDPMDMMESILPGGFAMLPGRSFMNRFQQLAQTILRSIDDTGTKHKDVLKDNAAEKLKNKNTHSYNELEIKDKNVEKENCSVCLESIKPENDKDDSYNKKVLLKLPCGHIFHSVCIMKWLIECNYKCPVCRKSCGSHHKVEDKDDE